MKYKIMIGDFMQITPVRPRRAPSYVLVLAAVVLGVAVGHWAPQTGIALKPIGDGFVKLVKMLIGPIIFCTVTSGIGSMEDLKRVGRIGAKALLYFEVITTIALGIGLGMVHWLKPGVGMNVNPATLDAPSVLTYAQQAEHSGGVAEFLLAMIPSSPVDAFARGDVLQILVFAVLFGFALSHLGERVRPITRGIEQLTFVFFRMISAVMRLAPLGAFGAMAFTIGKYGIGSLVGLAGLMGSFYLSCVLFVAVVLGGVARWTGFSLWALIRHLKEELLVVLGTSSSDSALPSLMTKLEALGCDKAVVGLVVPAGYSFNLDGTSIYLTLATVFIAQALGIQLSWSDELTILGVLLVSSKGAAGVTGSGFIVLAATLSSLKTVPVAGLALILGVDRFMSESRAITNLIGNAVATLVIAQWEGALNHEKLREGLKTKSIDS